MKMHAKTDSVDRLMSFDQLVELARKDAGMLGLILTGSRGKGVITEDSDYDCLLIVKDSVGNKYKKKYGAILYENMDFCIRTFSEFKKYASWNSPEAWDRYNFAYITPVVDKTGRLQKTIDEKAKIPRNELEKFIADALDGYINQVYRSVKCFRANNIIGFRLEATESIPLLLHALFALEGRHRPYNKYMEWELLHYPLKNLPWKPKKFVKMILEIATTSNLKTQQNILREIEKLFRAKGFGKVFDAWEGKDKWTMQFNPREPKAGA